MAFGTDHRPRIDFCFQGWVRGVEIETVTNVKDGFEVDVSRISAKTVALNLQKGVWALDFCQAYQNGNKVECELDDFEATT